MLHPSVGFHLCDETDGDIVSLELYFARNKSMLLTFCFIALHLHLVVDEIVGRHGSGEGWVLCLAVLADPLPPLRIRVLSPVQERLLLLLHRCPRFALHLPQYWIRTFISTIKITSVPVCFFLFSHFPNFTSLNDDKMMIRRRFLVLKLPLHHVSVWKLKME